MFLVHGRRVENTSKEILFTSRNNDNNINYETQSTQFAKSKFSSLYESTNLYVRTYTIFKLNT